MQVNTLKLNKRKSKKTIGRGGKKGTYSGKGCKGQKARSGAHVDPLFEGGRSTLIDHMKKKRGFKSRKVQKIAVSVLDLENKFNDGDTVNLDSLVASGLLKKSQKVKGVKIIGGKLTKKITFDKDIVFSKTIK